MKKKLIEWLFESEKDKSTMQKLEETHAEFHKIFQNAFGPRNLRDYAGSKGMTMNQGENWKFALTAQDIINEHIPANVVGCSGRAAVFSKLLQQRMIPHKVILTAVVDDLNRARNDIQQGKKPNIINGHQIIAVEIDGRLRMFDPGKKKLELIDGDVSVGRQFQYDFSDDNYIITNIMPPKEYEAINTPEKLQSAYRQIWNVSQIVHQNDDR